MVTTRHRWGTPTSTKGKPQEISRNGIMDASLTDGMWPSICVRVHHLARGVAAMRQAQPSPAIQMCQVNLAISITSTRYSKVSTLTPPRVTTVRRPQTPLWDRKAPALCTSLYPTNPPSTNVHAILSRHPFLQKRAPPCSATDRSTST